MKTKLSVLYLVFFIFIFILTNLSYAQVFKVIDEAYDSGQITVDEMMLNKIYRIFDPSIAG